MPFSRSKLLSTNHHINNKGTQYHINPAKRIWVMERGRRDCDGYGASFFYLEKKYIGKYREYGLFII